MSLDKKIKKLQSIQTKVSARLERVQGFRLGWGLALPGLLIFSQIIQGFYFELIAIFLTLPLFLFYFRKSLALKRLILEIGELIEFYQRQLDFSRGGSTLSHPPEKMSCVELARDLDLGILYANMDHCCSIEARKQLDEWLCQKFGESHRKKRQSGIQELLQYPGLLRKIQKKSKNHLIEFQRIEKEVARPFIHKTPWIWGVPISWAFLFVSVFFDTEGFLWKSALLIYAASLLVYVKETQFLFSRLQDLHKDFSELKSRMTSFEKLCKNLSFTRSLGKQQASKDIQSLGRFISLISLRTNPVIFYIINLLFPLDFFITKLSENSREGFYEHFKQWSREWVLVECLGCFANLKLYHNTQWAETNSDSFIETKDLRHPLIHQQQVVDNTFSPNGKHLIIITGSNMSGKSTFLRAIGINYCLANIGAPVFAKSFHFIPMKILSCIRVSDSLRDGQSYFFAEVQRMKKILNEAKQNPIFFLIDEPLRGTNNQERLIGNQHYLKQIVKTKACGFMSTHDLELTQLEKVSQAIANYHFSEQWKDNDLHFDYKIKKGPSQTTNALKILEKEGLYKNISS